MGIKGPKRDNPPCLIIGKSPRRITYADKQQGGGLVCPPHTPLAPRPRDLPDMLFIGPGRTEVVVIGLYQHFVVPRRRILVVERYVVAEHALVLITNLQARRCVAMAAGKCGSPCLKILHGAVIALRLQPRTFKAPGMTTGNLLGITRMDQPEPSSEPGGMHISANRSTGYRSSHGPSPEPPPLCPPPPVTHTSHRTAQRQCLTTDLFDNCESQNAHLSFPCTVDQVSGAHCRHRTGTQGRGLKKVSAQRCTIFFVYLVDQIALVAICYLRGYTSKSQERSRSAFPISSEWGLGRCDNAISITWLVTGFGMEATVVLEIAGPRVSIRGEYYPFP